jgi:glycosyltransferase involved in cell wall biosynthesis
MDYNRVIIIGETFRLNGGGGITMTNLFKEWPSSNIGVITDGIEETNPLSEYSYYQLGAEEVKFPFPFYILQRHIQSGPYTFSKQTSTTNQIEKKDGTTARLKQKIRPIFDKFLKLSGLYHSFYKIRLSESLKSWIIGFKPDIIYIQPFHSRTMQFGNLLFSEMKIPYAIHVMDDSVKYINHSIILRKFLQKRIESDFYLLVRNASVRMCISDAMAQEYQKRYGMNFSSFRNPIDVENWLINQKKKMSVELSGIKIVYNGRLYPPTHSSLIDMCKVVDNLNKDGRAANLDIYTHDPTHEFNEIIKGMMGITIFNPVPVSEIPGLIKQYDIFFICLDFDKEAQRYSRYSISTRTSEGMISAVPVLLYAPADTAMYKYFERNEAGCIVGERDIRKLEMAVMKLWNDSQFRTKVSNNAVKTAMIDSNSEVVRKEFRKALTID